VAVKIDALFDERIQVGRGDLWRQGHLHAAGGLVAAMPAGIGPSIVVEEDHQDVGPYASGGLGEPLPLAAVVPLRQALG